MKYIIVTMTKLSLLFERVSTSRELQNGFIKLTKKGLILTLAAWIVIATGGYLYLFKFNQKTEAVWFDENWSFRKPVELTVTTSASDITNLEMLITVDTSSGTLGSGNLQSSCQDLRFTNINGDALPYYIDSGCATSSTKIWIMADLVPKNTTKMTVYMYYGNPTAVAGSNEASFNLFKDLEGYWTLNDTSGNRTDSSVNNSTLTDTNTVTSNTGQYSNAGQFTAANTEYLTVADNTSLSMGNIDFTVSAWVYLDSEGANRAIITKYGGDAAANTEYVLFYGSAQDKFRFMVGNGTTETAITADTFGAVTTSTWYHVVGWHDAANDVLGISVNGISDTVSYSGGVTDTAQPFRLGASGTASLLWNGRIDDARVYKRVLSSDDRSKLYTNPGTITTTAIGTIGPTQSYGSVEKAPSPRGNWKFDEGTGTTTANSGLGGVSMVGNMGTGTSAPSWQTEDQCISGKCLRYDGSDIVTVSDTYTPTAYSYSMWVKPTAVTSKAIFVRTDSSGPNSSFSHELRITAGGNFEHYTYDGGSKSVTGSTVVEANKWYFVTITAENSGQSKLYVNGRSEGTPASIGTLWASGDRYYLGTFSNGYGGFQGTLDEVKFYPYARSPAQILADYNSKTGGDGGGAVLGASSANRNLSNGLVGYWKMDETATPAVDSSGNANSGTWTGGATSAAGKFGNSISLDGTGDYITAADSNSLDITNNITLSAWINPTSLAGGADTIISKQNNYSFHIVANKLRFFNGSSMDDTGASISTGVWTHVAVSISNSAVTFYQNGQFSSSVPLTGSLTANTQPLDIGFYPGGDASHDFNGKIDEARVYNRVLSPAEVSQLYNFAPGPIGYWNFEDTTPTTTSALDRSGNSYTATWATSNATHYNSGKFGKGGKFSASANDLVTVPDTGNPWDFGANDFSISFWQNTKASTVSSNAAIIGKRVNAAATSAFVIFRVSGNMAFFATSNGSAWDIANNAIIGSVTGDTWIHFEVTRVGSTISYYKNGVLTGTTTSSATILGNSDSLVFGGDTNSAFLDGSLDDIKIYNYGRTQKQVVEDMNGGHPNVGSPVGSAVGHWKLDEGQGTTANNSGSAGTSLVGTLNTFSSPATSTSGWSNSGKFGKSLIFDGASDYVSIPSNSATSGTSFTMSAWINTTTTAAGFAAIMEHNRLGNNFYGLWRNGNLLHFRWNSSQTGNSVKTLSANTWYHVVGTYDSVTSTAKIYINGTLDSAASGQTNPTATDAITTIGATNSPGEYFSGKIDNVKIYNYALTTDEVSREYNQGSSLVLGASGDNSSYEKGAANQEYCIPGDTTTCTAPAGRWDFEEKTGQSAYDISGNNSTGTLGSSGSVSTDDPSWTTGKIGAGLGFDGGDYVDAGSPTALDISGAITVSAWIKPIAISGQGVNYFISKFSDDDGVSDTGWAFGYLGTNPACSSNDGVPFVFETTTNVVVCGSTAMNTANWYHVVFTNDGTTTRIYLNGKLDGSGTQTWTEAASSNFNIGRRSDGTLYSNAYIDSVKVFNYARTPDQIAYDYNKGAPIGWWKMDECQGDRINDSSGNGLTATWTGSSGSQTTPGTCASSATTPWYQGRVGKFNSSMNFDGTDDSVATTSNIGISGANSRSVSVWFYQSSLANRTMVGWGAATGGNLFDFIVSSGTVLGHFFGAGFDTSVGAPSYSTGVWNHAVMTYDGTTVKVYLNGVFKNSKALTLNTTNSVVRIGDGYYDPYRYFSGQIDDVRIYNYPLTPTQIKTLYNGGAVRFGPLVGSP